MNKKISNIVTSLVFCALTTGLTVASLVTPTKKYSETENRNLAQMPVFSLDSLFDGKFTTDYEEFITDQFVGRDSWITIKTYAELALGKRESGDVFFADDGYLIEKIEVNNEQLEKNMGFLESFLKNTEGKYNTHVLIAPTASLILKDKLPAYAPVWDQSATLDRISEMGNFVDCRPILTEHKNEDIYYRTDHHWTTLGSYYAYVELCSSLGITPLALDELTKNVLSDKFYGTMVNKVNIKVDPDELYALETDMKLTVKYNGGAKVTDTIYEMSHLNTKSKYSVFLNENQPMVEITSENKNGKTLLVVKDSYAHCMVPMLVNHYENVILLDFRALNGYLVGNFIPMLEAQGYSIDDIVLLYNADNFTKEPTLQWIAK